MAESIKVLVPEEEVDARIRALGEQISKDYEGKQIHLICVLKGGVFFMCYGTGFHGLYVRGKLRRRNKVQRCSAYCKGSG